MSANSYSVGAGVNFDYKGFGGGYYLTKYDGVNPDRGQMAQTVGGISLKFRDVSVRVENDIFGDGGDKGRTNALEIGIKGFLIGTNLYTNNGRTEGGGKNMDGTDMRGRRNEENGAWRNGKVYSAPLWIGTQFDNTVDRVGYSHPVVQNYTQNSIHISKLLPFAHAPFFTNYGEFRTGFYNYSSFYNPYSLFER